MGSRSLEGMEVPITGSDSVKWLQLSVPFSSPYSTAAAATNGTLALLPQPYSAPATRDSASCSIVGDPSTYLFWNSLTLSLAHTQFVIRYPIGILEQLQPCAIRPTPVA
ncbi:hypothetical protein RHMOL_Rhmol11G0174300 [Rhododendron molle]|uniref:Uncharacterized protein n=1 Tax=Rhododendron molle TaxID=49168 RepID=A0ACC0LTI3_RHOML|nr:hypothetical protein RHMOL_Rhmol11G0174300 [Rhododendron molle]